MEQIDVNLELRLIHKSGRSVWKDLDSGLTCAGRLALFLRFFSRLAASAVAASADAAVAAAASDAALLVPPESPAERAKPGLIPITQKQDSILTCMITGRG